MKKENKNSELGLYVKITEEENIMVKKMKKTYCINMSQFIRNSIKDFYNKLEQEDGQTKKI